MCPASGLDARASPQLREVPILLGPPDRFRQAEVQHLDSALRRDLDIGWFQVAVNDALVVRRFQRLRDLECAVRVRV